VTAVLAEAGADTSGVAAYLEGDGRAELERICRDAEEKGVFGVPSFILDGELFWGREHLPDIRGRLAAPPVAKAS
jgi:2-hydroxychromene-2-carboxylate isomerase